MTEDFYRAFIRPFLQMPEFYSLGKYHQKMKSRKDEEHFVSEVVTMLTEFGILSEAKKRKIDGIRILRMLKPKLPDIPLSSLELVEKRITEKMKGPLVVNKEKVQKLEARKRTLTESEDSQKIDLNKAVKRVLKPVVTTKDKFKDFFKGVFNTTDE